ncbi:MAG: diguanylate cyclase domain-containing protein [Bacillota bacterium]
MDISLWLIFIVIAIISLLPLTRLDLFSVSKKYTYFKYLSIFLFIWTLVIFLRFVISNSLVLYFLLLTTYPLVFVLTTTVFLAIMSYLEKQVSRIFKYFLIGFLFVELFIAYTNHFNGLMLDIPYQSGLTIEEINSANPGIIFYVHTIFCYLLLVISMGLISFRMYKRMIVNEDFIPFIVLITGIIFGIVVNILHVFFFDFVLDPTYLAFVLFTSILYFIFYIRDIRIILKMNNYQYILDNLREMYLITDQNDRILDASTTLIEKITLDLDKDLKFSEFIKNIENQAIIYETGKKLESDYNPKKMYLHMQKKPINLPFLKYSGHFYLFYDETKIQKYINDINYARNHDLMTDLYNRNYFEDIRNDYEDKKNYGFIMFDLDGLKLFNDYLGHRAGDKLLSRFANKLKQIAKDKDIIPIRMGGDEFLLIVENANKEKYENIIDKLKFLTKSDDKLKNIGFSYGCALSNKEKTTSSTLKKADEKMYKMKEERFEEKEELEKLLKKRTNK